MRVWTYFNFWFCYIRGKGVVFHESTYALILAVGFVTDQGEKGQGKKGHAKTMMNREAGKTLK